MLNELNFKLSYSTLICWYLQDFYPACFEKLNRNKILKYFQSFYGFQCTYIKFSLLILIVVVQNYLTVCGLSWSKYAVGFIDFKICKTNNAVKK